MAGKLKNIFQKSFPANNLLEFSLVKDTDPELPFYKNRYFCYVSIMPGKKGDNGNRTFDKTGRITIKTECDKLIALGKSLRYYAQKLGNVAKFTIYADSTKGQYSNGQGSVKQCFASEWIQKDQQGNVKDPVYGISLKEDKNNPIGVFWTAVEAMAVADIIEEFFGKEGIRLEMAERKVQVGNIAQAPEVEDTNNNGSYEPNVNTNFTPPPPNMGNGGFAITDTPF